MRRLKHQMRRDYKKEMDERVGNNEREKENECFYTQNERELKGKKNVFCLLGKWEKKPRERTKEKEKMGLARKM